MRSSHLAAPLALVLAFQTGLELQAQQPRPVRPSAAPQPSANQNPGPSRPGGQVGKSSVQQTSAQAPAAAVGADEEFPITPELEEILQQWEAKSSQIKTIHGTHLRTTYNLVFEEERRASGTFFLKTPDMGRIDLVGTESKKGDKSARLKADGTPYGLYPDSSSRWICTGKEIIVINDEDKSYEVVPLPKETQGSNIVHSPLPFLFGMKAEEAKHRYRIKLHSNSRDRVILVIFPRFPTDRQNYVEAWIILDKSNFAPVAVKLYDPTGKVETVYKFEATINDRSFGTRVAEALGIRDKNPLQPDLRGYKYVLPPAVEEEPPRKNVQLPQRPAPARPIR